MEGSTLGTIDGIAGALVVMKRELVGVAMSVEVVVDPPPVTVIVPTPSPAF